MQARQDRRRFLSSITGLTIGAATQGRPQPAWDTAWLDSFRGRHKQLFDLLWHDLRPNTLSPPMNFLDAHKELSGLEFPDINIVIGADSTSFPITATDALWARFKLGERYNIKDPATGQPAVKNVYLGPVSGGPGATVRALQARGAVFLMCNNSLRRLSTEWSRELGQPAPELHAELAAGLHPGVRVVPALTWAVGALQERGFTLQKL